MIAKAIAADFNLKTLEKLYLLWLLAAVLPVLISVLTPSLLCVVVTRAPATSAAAAARAGALICASCAAKHCINRKGQHAVKLDGSDLVSANICAPQSSNSRIEMQAIKWVSLVKCW
jgi:hypothetical protein